MKIGQFIYPWGNGHYTRMMHLDSILKKEITQLDIHYFSKGEIYDKLCKKFDKTKIHKVLMPTPIDGKTGPSLSKSLLNLLFSVQNNPTLIKQISSYLKDEARYYNKEKFDLVINDGDVGSNILAQRRNIPSLFITNQFRPRLWSSRFYLYPGMYFVSKQIAKASKIIVADSPPPYTMCEYNLNFPKNMQKNIIYAGHFSQKNKIKNHEKTILDKLIVNNDFGYWIRTGNKSTNDYTGQRYEQVFAKDEMKKEKRLISHARLDPSIDSVLSREGIRYSLQDAYDKKIDWIQIDIGFLDMNQKDVVLDAAKYVVINGSHTIMGEVLGIMAKPIIGVPLYDEHTNQLQWAQDKGLGIMAQNSNNITKAVDIIHKNIDQFESSVKDFSKNFVPHGAQKTVSLIKQMLKNK